MDWALKEDGGGEQGEMERDRGGRRSCCSTPPAWSDGVSSPAATTGRGSGEARANGWGVPNFIKTIMSFVMFKQIV